MTKKNRILRKLHTKSGMSLAETLLAVLILSLVSTGLAAGMNLAYGQFAESMRRSQSHVLCSTIRSALANELRYTKTIRTDGNQLREFYSQNYHIDSSYSQILILSEEDTVTGGYGYVALGSETEHKKLLSDSSYNYDLGARIRNVTYDSDKSIFSMTISIGSRKTGTLYAEETFDVRNANKAETIF